MLYGMLDIDKYNIFIIYLKLLLIDVSEVCGLWYILRLKENRELRLCDL